VVGTEPATGEVRGIVAGRLVGGVGGGGGGVVVSLMHPTLAPATDNPTRLSRP
jgi:hypothetical protein